MLPLDKINDIEGSFESSSIMDLRSQFRAKISLSQNPAKKVADVSDGGIEFESPDKLRELQCEVTNVLGSEKYGADKES